MSAFATTADVKARLEEATLSTEATAAAAMLLDTATAVICMSAAEGDTDWFDDLPSVRQDFIKGLTVELVCRAMASPQGLTSATETLGAFSRSEDYRRDLSTALLLTPQEEQIVKKIAGSPVSASVRIPSLVHDVYVTES